MPFIRSLLLLLALPLALSACKDESPPQGQEPEVPLGPVEAGDWEDTGPFAECPIRSGECGSLETFEVSACAPGTLSGFTPDGVYTVQMRYASASVGGFRTTAMGLSSSGGPEFLGPMDVEAREVDSDTVFYRGRRETSTGPSTRSFFGCRMPGADQLQGCFDECLNGKRTSRGTFQARRVSPAPGEAVASGLSLISETRMKNPNIPLAGLAGMPVDVYVTKKHAYVVSLGGGLFVYDVEFPERPVFQTQVYRSQDTYWNGVWAKGDALYVASANRGILVFDIRDPGAPTLVRNVPAGATNVHTVFVSGDLLFGTAQEPDSAVLVFDVKEPLQPVLIAKFQAQGSSDVGPHDLFTFEDRLYVNFWSTGYVVAGLERPDAPNELGRYRYEYATSHANAVGRFGDRLIAFEGGEGWGAHLRVLDVTDPAHISLIGEWRTHEHISIHNMVLVGTKLYVAHYHDGVRVLNVSVPETPREVAHFNTFRATDEGRGTSFYDGAVGIRVPGDGYVYTVDTSRGLLILREE
ncbi:LVIVD repeat-containing protein [Hyalangium rubrum]|uniref:Lipoprotein n=1 Tax=Hyalangium rubrum TaxID=3103134 RepID=A0ABU5GZH7_9BACT|nr:hypothetical protein [Hyalangium sp. s54d21]MDY7226595.1 hypothetical protein [Hyalangium sp. s54d21]